MKDFDYRRRYLDEVVEVEQEDEPEQDESNDSEGREISEQSDDYDIFDVMAESYWVFLKVPDKLTYTRLTAEFVQKFNAPEDKQQNRDDIILNDWQMDENQRVIKVEIFARSENEARQEVQRIVDNMLEQIDSES